jgi:hypothetical protein
MTQGSALKKLPTDSAPAQSLKSNNTALALVADSTTSRQLMLALRPRGLDTVFQQVGRGYRIKCPQCPYAPPKQCSSYQKWELVSWHLGMVAEGRAKHLTRPPKYKIIEGNR